MSRSIHSIQLNVLHSGMGGLHISIHVDTIVPLCFCIHADTIVPLCFVYMVDVIPKHWNAYYIIIMIYMYKPISNVHRGMNSVDYITNIFAIIKSEQK